MLKIGIIIGSTRDGRVSVDVAEWVKSFTEGHSEADNDTDDEYQGRGKGSGSVL